MPSRSAAGDRWWGWGDAAREYPPEQAARFVAALERRFGALPRTPGVPLARVVVPRSRLVRESLARLERGLGTSKVTTAHRERIRHAFGQSYPELVRAMAGELRAAPDAVLFPASHDAVRDGLVAAEDLGVAVIPFGGGTSVTGSVEGGTSPFVALSTRALDRVRAIDQLSGTATVEAGIYGPALEAALGTSGFTLGHFPQSFEHSTLGGWLATRSAGQQSTGYGKIEDLVIGARVATVRGDLVLPPRPAAAEGPDLLQLVLGSEGELGVVTEATLRLRRVPELRRYEGWLLPSFERGLELIRDSMQRGVRPTAVRLSDEAEMATFGALGGATPSGGTLLIVGSEGGSDEVAGWHGAFAALVGAQGRSLGTAAGDAWYAHRFELPYLRDVLLERGLLVDVIETAALWADLPRLYAAVSSALSGSLADAIVLCHVSHAYDVGASLYFTFIARREIDWEAQWWRAKRSAIDAIATNAGVISHHHGIGTHHRAWLERRLGPRGTAVLDALRATLDPRGTLRRSS